MSKEKLIDLFKEGIDFGFDIFLEEEEKQICIEALEKQIAKDIHIYANGTEHCPNCDANLTGMGFRYCVECGQALKI